MKRLGGGWSPYLDVPNDPFVGDRPFEGLRGRRFTPARGSGSTHTWRELS
jgi:hypothetical protein